ncbi:MAG: hypothetical protein G8345_10850 [Magnetococcales bacterium]|nr:hypothetical protein [Magnetococcales bacterium]NGZ27370.1 hypothetical protein [Magnetococcales bacterium]
MKPSLAKNQEGVWRHQKGNLLLIIMMMIMVASVMVAAVAKMASSNSVAGLDSLYATEALYFAESGLEAARYKLINGGCSTSATTLSGTFPRGANAVTVSAGPPWTITSTGYAPSQASPRGKRILVQVIPSTGGVLNPLIAGTLNITGTSAQINGVTVTGTGNSIRSNAVRETVTQTFPSFPIFQNASGNSTLSTNFTVNGNSNYRTVTVSSGGTGTYNAGTHRVRTLNMEGGTLNLATGIYYIDRLDIKTDNSVINPTGAVVIYLNDFVLAKKLLMNTQVGYAVGNMTIYVYTSFNNSSSQTAVINGVMVGDPNATFSSSGNITIDGGVYGQSTIGITSGTFNINYSAAAQTAAEAIMGTSLGCSNVTSWDETF